MSAQNTGVPTVPLYRDRYTGTPLESSRRIGTPAGTAIGTPSLKVLAIKALEERSA